MANTAYTTTSGSLTLPHYTQKQGYRQVPFNPEFKPPLSYLLHELILDRSNTGGYSGKCGAVLWGEIYPQHGVLNGLGATSLSFSTHGNIAYARAYTKFKDSVYAQASNLTAIQERSKTIDMVAKRLSQLHKGAKALKAGRFREFLRIFGIRPLKKHENTRWTRPKEFGGMWLEYWMGWAPTIGDVYLSLEALSRPIPNDTIRTGSKTPFSRDYRQSSGSAKATSSYKGECTVWVQGIVSITNPSLHAVQKLGLINPAKTMWETTPFSWFVDWFTNVGQVLGQVTDWVGLQLKNLIVSCKTRATSSWLCEKAKTIFGPAYPDTMFHNKSWLWFSRHMPSSMPTVAPKLQLPNGLSLTRGATLASLLATMFAPSRR